MKRDDPEIIIMSGHISCAEYWREQYSNLRCYEQDKTQLPTYQYIWAPDKGQGCSETLCEQEAEECGLVLLLQVRLCSFLLLVDFMRRNPSDI